jgi:hypothetical protein
MQISGEKSAPPRTNKDDRATIRESGRVMPKCRISRWSTVSGTESSMPRTDIGSRSRELYAPPINRRRENTTANAPNSSEDSSLMRAILNRKLLPE